MNTKFILPLCCLCLSLSSCDDSDLAGPAMNPERLKQIDTDGDGVISPDERAEAKKMRGERSTPNSTGKTARPAARAANQRAAGSEEQRNRVIKRFDADGDGVLNEDERAAAKAAIQERRAGNENE